MKPVIEETHLQDVILVSGDKHADDRGCFMEAFNSGELLGKFQNTGTCRTTRFQEHVTLFPQDNLVYSKPNVLRGLHIMSTNPQGKLIRCITGKIFDVIVDLRPYSSTYKKWGSFELNSQHGKALWVPPGFAHGYYSYKISVVYYKCTTLYDERWDGGINAMDPKLGITWPNDCPIMSKKDQKLPSLDDWLKQ